jgi:hypothetical protein
LGGDDLKNETIATRVEADHMSHRRHSFT